MPRIPAYINAYSTMESVQEAVVDCMLGRKPFLGTNGARRFVEAWNAEGPAHHCAVGVGHIARRIEKLGKLLNLEVVTVC